MKNYKGKLYIKNTQAKVYYRDNIQREFKVFLEKVVDYVLKNYETSKIFNSKYKQNKKEKEKESKVLKYIKRVWLPILLSRCNNIIVNWTIKAQNPIKKSIFSIIKDILSVEKRTITLNKNILEQVLKIIIKRNVDLISNLATQTMTNIENIVSNSLLSGETLDNLKKKLNIINNIPQWRINLIATDQTNKFNEAVNRIIQNQFGVEYFVWYGLADGKEREEHLKLNDKIFKWGDSLERLPIIDKKGTRGYPAESVNCRCQALPYIPQGQAKWLGNNKGYQFV